MNNTNTISLNEHIQSSIDREKTVNESIVLATIICTACISYSCKGVLETDFMKHVGSGIGGFLGGLGNMFGLGGFFGRSRQSSVDEIRALLDKDPDDLTGREKDLLKKAAKNSKLQKEFSNNELKKLNKLVKGVKVDKDDKEDDDTQTPNETPEKFTKEHLSALLMLAKSERDKLDEKNRSKEDDAIFDLLVACSYDKDGKMLEISEMKEKMKDVVGEDQWESFSARIDESYNEVKDSDKFIDALSKFEKELSEQEPEKREERIEAFQTEAKERAKVTMQKIEERKAEQKRIEDEIAKVEEELNSTNDDDDEAKKKLKTKLDKLKADLDKTKSPIEGLPVSSNKPAEEKPAEEKPAEEKPAKGESTEGGEKPAKGESTEGGEKPAEEKPAKGEKKPNEYTNKDIENLQNELSELDPENKDHHKKIKEKEKLLKAIAKAKGKDESAFIPKIEMAGKGDNKKPVQKKVGPRGAKYFRTKGKNGWGQWRWYKSESDLTSESNYEYNQLKNYLYEQLE
jgi:hypothetical protein